MYKIEYCEETGDIKFPNGDTIYIGAGWGDYFKRAKVEERVEYAEEVAKRGAMTSDEVARLKASGLEAKDIIDLRENGVL